MPRSVLGYQDSGGTSDINGLDEGPPLTATELYLSPITPTAPAMAASKDYVDNAIGVATHLQGAYNNSTANPEIQTNDSGGAVTIRKGTSGPEDDVVLEIQNSVGNTALAIDGRGRLNGIDVQSVVDDVATLQGEMVPVQNAVLPAAIKTAYESNADTNALTDVRKLIVDSFALASAADTPLLVSNLDNASPSYDRATVTTIGAATYAFVSTPGGVLAYDLTDPHAPVYHAGPTGAPLYTIAALDAGGTQTESISVTDGATTYLYSCAGGQGLDVFDVSAIGAGTVPASTNPITTGASFDGIVQASAAPERVAIAAGGQGVRFLDLTNKAAPSEGATLDNGAGYTSLAINAAGTLVFANYGAGLEVLNTATWLSPSSLGTTPLSGPAKGCFYEEANTRLYICRGSAGLICYDVSTPSAPVTLGSYAMNANDVWADADHVYVAQQGGDLLVLTPGTLALANTIAEALDPNGVVAFGGGSYLAVSDGTNGLSVFSLQGGLSTAGNLLIGGVVEAHELREATLGEGVVVEAVLLRDGLVDGEDVAGLGTRLTAAEGNVTALDGRVTTAEGGVSTNAGDITTLDGRLTTAEGVGTTNAGDILALGGRVTTNEGDIATLESTVAGLGAGGGAQLTLYEQRILSATLTTTDVFAAATANIGGIPYVITSLALGILIHDVSDPTAPVLVGGRVGTGAVYETGNLQVTAAHLSVFTAAGRTYLWGSVVASPKKNWVGFRFS